MKRIAKPTAGENIYILGIALAVAYWLLETVADVVLFGGGDFLDQFFHPQQHELWMRTVPAGIMILFGFIANRVVRARNIAQQKILIGEQRYRQLVDSASEAIACVDSSGKVLLVNEACAEFLGGRPENFQNKQLEEILPRKFAADLLTIAGQVIKSGAGRTLESSIILNNEERWFQSNIQPLIEEEGRPKSALIISSDVTEVIESRKQLENLAEKDSLTGLFNRRKLFEIIETEFSRARRYGSPLVICICDFDDFKSVNDNHGHSVGDAALRAFAECLTENIRAESSAGRYGGDEFIIIFPHSGSREAKIAIERIKNSFEQTDIETSGGKMIRCKISIGLAELMPEFENYQQLFKAADDALLKAKHDDKGGIQFAAKGG